MWEEHPEYQKAQARMVGLLVALLFIGSAIYCVSIRDWDLLMLVLYAGVGLFVALALLPLAAWLIIKVLRRLRGSPSKPNSDHEA
jgi:flagellar biogenesis protein FliO